MATTRTSVGFIGIGAQGGPIAERILGAGFPLTVWARRPEALAAFGKLGATTAAAVRDLGDCEVVGICVVDDAGVREVFDALLPWLKPGAVVLVLATVSPDTCRTLADRARARGVAVLDAPVSGGGEVARSGALTVMVGGDGEALARCRPILDSFAARVFHLGPVGAGQTAKLLNNALLTAHLALATEVLSAGAAFGLDRAVLAELLATSSGRSYGVELAARLASPGAFATGAALLRKDVDLLTDLAREAGAKTALTLTAAETFLRAVDADTKALGS